MNNVYDLVVLGAGSGGAKAAEFAAKMGARVALIDFSAEKMGGEGAQAGCVFSKSLIYAARQPHPRWRLLRQHARQAVEQLRDTRNNPEVFGDMGVDTYFGAVKVLSGQNIKIGKHTIAYKKLLVATGSTQRLPSIADLKTVDFETADTLFDMRNAPRSVAIIGGGPVGVELAFVLRRLGVTVHIIEHNPHILHYSDPEAAELVQDALEDKDVTIHTSASVTSVVQRIRRKVITLRNGDTHKILRVTRILVATGRQAVLPAGLPKGVRLDGGAIAVDDRWQTSDENIYAVGDCTNFGHESSHAAAAAAIQAASHALYSIKSRQDMRLQPHVFFTEPEVAQVGPTVTKLNKNGTWHTVHKLPFSAIDKALIDDEDGFIKVATDRLGRVISATIVGRHANELIGYFAIAIDKRWRLSDLASAPLPYPTFSFGIKELAHRVQLEQIQRKKRLLGWARKITLR